MIQLVRGDLNKQQRAELGALITLDVHAKEVTSRLIRERCDDINAFGW
jgi:dynein heavy chain